MKKIGLYVHIPFCLKKCNYCDFLSHCNISFEEHGKYIHALLNEIEYYKDKSIEVESVYIGGGTPSLIDGEFIVRIINKIRQCFTLNDQGEITIEANPGLISKDKLKDYLDSGINRLSLGAQSLDDETLAFLGRVHSSLDFTKSFNLAREAGFKNISVDLIFAVPGQTLRSWEDTLMKVIDMKPEHISFYGLQIEEGTPFFNSWKEGSLKATEDYLDRKMYHRSLELLKGGGYQHYEISNAAIPGYESKHNLKYWSMEEYLGLGLGAHSYINGSRFSNVTDYDSYTSLHKAFPLIAASHKNSKEDHISEYMFTGLRKIEGLSLNDFKNRFGLSMGAIYEEAIIKHKVAGLLEGGEESGNLRLTEKGLDLFNVVLADFILLSEP